MVCPDSWKDRLITPLRVLIVDDHQGFRASARALLEADGFEVVGEAEDGASGRQLAASLQPDLILLDVGLPDTDGFAVCQSLVDGDADTLVVLTSSRDRDDYGSLVDRCGALGFVPKGELSGAALTSLAASR